MNREIKFRAWDNHLKEMTHNIHWLDSFNEYISKTKYTCLQFTGLKDKKGKEIYQGDICELVVDFDGYETEHYSQDSFHFKYTGVVCFMPSTGFHLKIYKSIDCEIDKLSKEFPKRKNIVQYRTTLIGNIHENKELLK